MNTEREISHYRKFISDKTLCFLLDRARPVAGVDGLCAIDPCRGLETAASLHFACELYAAVKDDLDLVLTQREIDRHFIDAKTQECVKINSQNNIPYADSAYQTVLAKQDERGRTVVGPLTDAYHRSAGPCVAELPDWLAPPHVTLFGPPDSAKLSINAMNSFHRAIKDEPRDVADLLTRSKSLPKWGADDEDSKTPLHGDLVLAGDNLKQCFDGTLRESEGDRTYAIKADKQALPIKRIPGLALPCTFLFYHGNPLPLHIYDFALHLFHCRMNPRALVFYIPKLENEEEARYLKKLISTAEDMIGNFCPSYQPGSVRLMVVIENPRAIFRVNEIMDTLQPYFAGASLGWHDYLASTARLFKEDAHYRIPVKSDPDIVIKYIKASHELLANVVGGRGGIKVGGMYGVLPLNSDLKSRSFQVTIKGYIRDVITQLKRNLNGFWVAHPDFVRIGLALVQGWREFQDGDQLPLENLVKALLLPHYHAEMLAFIYGADSEGLDCNSVNFPRALLAADLQESQLMSNSDAEEVRYNVFQTLQYLADWLCGNGCVALPAAIEGEMVRVMDDLATAERSRWEVWHEVRHGRFKSDDLVTIIAEEIDFITANRKSEQKQVQVVWNERTAKWYPVAVYLTVLMMTQTQPVEFATELLLPFTLDAVRASADPLAFICQLEGDKYQLEPEVKKMWDARLQPMLSLRPVDISQPMTEPSY